MCRTPSLTLKTLRGSSRLVSFSQVDRPFRSLPLNRRKVSLGATGSSPPLTLPQHNKKTTSSDGSVRSISELLRGHRLQGTLFLLMHPTLAAQHPASVLSDLPIAEFLGESSEPIDLARKLATLSIRKTLFFFDVCFAERCIMKRPLLSGLSVLAC